MFSTPDIPNFYTEQFGSGNDLDYLRLFFTPDGSVDYYRGCAEEIEALPTDPAGGTPLSISEDSYATVTLSGGAQVWLYGVSYSHFYVGDNGYLTFTGGDTEYTETLDWHFAMPRVSALFDDLSVAYGTVSWKQLDDRAVVTYANVPEWSSSSYNTFQVELYFNGDIQIAYLALGAADGIVGLSEGEGLSPDYYPADLSGMGPCGPYPPTAEDGLAYTPMNTPVMIGLLATDDGLPDPPAALTYVIGSLPEHGVLSDPGAGVIEDVPYELVAGGNAVLYRPGPWYMGVEYFQFYANDGGEPPEGGNSNIAAVVVHVTGPEAELVYAYPLDEDVGWSMEGEWAFGVPAGGGTHGGDPTAGHTGANVYGYNLSGDYSSDMAACEYLTTTALDCRFLHQVELRFWRWLGVESSEFDQAVVEVSNDGVSWVELWRNPPVPLSDGLWKLMVFDISGVADEGATVWVRWGMGPTDDSVTYPGWNVDDVEVWGIQQLPGDLDGDCDVDLGDLGILLAHYGQSGDVSYADGDLTGDGVIDLSDLGILLAYYGQTCP
jgi:hypothetical protein